MRIGPRERLAFLDFGEDGRDCGIGVGVWGYLWFPRIGSGSGMGCCGTGVDLSLPALDSGLAESSGTVCETGVDLPLPVLDSGLAEGSGTVCGTGVGHLSLAVRDSDLAGGSGTVC